MGGYLLADLVGGRQERTVRIAGAGIGGVPPSEIGGYMDRQERELRDWMARDPVDICRNTLVAWKVIDAAKAAAMEAAVKQEVLDAVAWADKQPFCKPEDGLKNVFVEGSVLPRQVGSPTAIDSSRRCDFAARITNLERDNGKEELHALGPRGRSV